MTLKVEYIKLYKGFKINGKKSKCWIWQGCLQKGYGKCTPNKQHFYTQKAHRYMLLKHGVKIPKGKELDHLCCQKDCVNPLHLEVVSKVENIRRRNERDKNIGKRTHVKYPHMHRKRRLIDDTTALKVFKLYNKGNYRFCDIAKLLNVNQHSVRKICLGKAYHFIKR